MTEMNGQVISKKTYNKHLIRARGTGDFFTFSRSYVKLLRLSKYEALFIQDIINKAAMRKTKMDENGYFLCTTRYLEKSLDWDKNTQKRLFASLKNKNYIKTKGKGIPSKRHVAINMTKIEEDLDDALENGPINWENPTASQLARNEANWVGPKQGQLCSPKQGHKEDSSYEESEKKKKHCQNSPSRIPDSASGNVIYERHNGHMPSSNGRGAENKSNKTNSPSRHQPRADGEVKNKDTNTEDPAHNCAALMYNKFVTRSGMARRTKFGSWIAFFRKLISELSADEVKHTLLIYLKHTGQEYWPVCRSAESFYKKYEQVLDAMDREEKRKQRSIDTNRLPNSEMP